MAGGSLRYFIDSWGHLVCLPYSVENLHRMAQDLGINRCWFHRDHYDTPRKKYTEIALRCEHVRPRDTLAIIRGKK